MSEPAAALPWIEGWLASAPTGARGHAWLVQVPAGSGALAFAMAAARAWLCEGSSGPGADSDSSPRRTACGRCDSCRLAAAHTHPDLRLRVSEVEALSEGLPVDVDEKRKPSRQIRVDEVRELSDWIVTTSGRGRGKVAVIHPAEAMNATAASALLKTLEEPPKGVRWLLTTADLARLLPTIRSRCQLLTLPPVARAQAVAWLVAQGVVEPEVLLDAAAGQPLAALQWHREGLSAASWTSLPAAVARGDAAPMSGWGVPRAVDALQKLCHDAAVRAAGGKARFFPEAALPDGAQLSGLVAWHKRLQAVSRHAEHPWNEALVVEALVSEGQQAWDGAKGRARTAAGSR